MENNLRLLEEVTGLVPNQGISVRSFRRLYPSSKALVALLDIYYQT